MTSCTLYSDLNGTGQGQGHGLGRAAKRFA